MWGSLSQVFCFGIRDKSKFSVINLYLQKERDTLRVKLKVKITIYSNQFPGPDTRSGKIMYFVTVM